MINIGEIRATVPLSSVLPETTAGGICPFCASGRFRLSVERRLYTYPDCGEKGDVITATMKLEGVGFQPCRHLAEERVRGLYSVPPFLQI